MDDLLSRMYGEEVVIHNKDGYHYGRLRSYDGKMFYLEQYYFNKKLIDRWNYSSASFFNKDGMLPADNIISISKMPSYVEDPEQDLADLLYVLKRRYAEEKAKNKKQEKSNPQALLPYQ